MPVRLSPDTAESGGGNGNRSRRAVGVFVRLAGLCALVAAGGSAGMRAAEPGADPERAVKALAVEKWSGSEPLEFYRDILPILQPNCLPCHNKTTTKADLLLETPEDMLRGGESGPALVPGKAAESLLFRVSAHVSKPRMPPKDNKANAVNLTARELGLLEAWIDQGAKASARQAVEIRWEEPSERIQSTYALAMAADGHLAAAGRGNRLLLFNPRDGVRLGWLTDGGLSTNAAPVHRDLVNAVAVSPDGGWIASGGFREVKVWRRATEAPSGPRKGSSQTNALPLKSTAGGRVLRLDTNGVPELSDDKGQRIALLDPRSRLPWEDAARSQRLAQAEVEARRARLASDEKEHGAQQDRWKKAVEAVGAARKALDEKKAVEAKLARPLALADGVRERAERRGAATNELKTLREAADAARKALEGATKEVERAQQKLDTAGEELRLAGIVRDRFATAVLVSRSALREAEQTVRQATAGAALGIVSADFSPSGRRVAVVGRDGVHVWSAESGAWVASVSAPPGKAWPHAVFRDESTLNLGLDGATVQAWSFEPTYVLAARLGSGGADSPIPDRVNALAFRSDGRRLASGSGEPTRGGEVRVWDPESGKPLYAFTNLHSDTVLALAWSPDGSRLASGGADRFARVVDVADGRVVAQLEGHTAHVLGVSWRADGRVLATGGAEGMVKFWTLGSADRAKSVGGFPKEIVALNHLGSGGDVIAIPGEGEPTRVTEGGEKPATLPGAKDFQHAAASTWDGRWVLAAGQDGVVRLWDVEAKKLVREIGR